MTIQGRPATFFTLTIIFIPDNPLPISKIVSWRFLRRGDLHSTHTSAFFSQSRYGRI